MTKYADIFSRSELIEVYGPALLLPKTFLLPDGSDVRKYTPTEVNEMSTVSAEYEAKIANLMDAGDMTGQDALLTAQGICKTLVTARDILVEKKDCENVGQVYERIKDAFLLAAEKVSGRDRCMVVDASAIWNQRALDTQLKLILQRA